MMIMTTRVDLKKIILIIAGAAALILAAILLLGGGEGEAAPTAAPDVTGNEGRVQFLQSFGWDVVSSPKESGQVKIPETGNEVFDRYNVLQKGQGYDLNAHAGHNVMRYVYQINNYPGATGPVYATLLIHKGQVIGGDVTDTSPGGRIRGFKMPETPATPATEATESSSSEP